MSDVVRVDLVFSSAGHSAVITSSEGSVTLVASDRVELVDAVHAWLDHRVNP